MKRLIAIALLAAAGAGNSTETQPWFAFAVVPDSIRAYENTAGSLQYDAIVMFAGDQGSGDARVGVVGCQAGRGQTAQVDEDGNPQTAARDWEAARGLRRDQVALSICLVAARLQARPQAPAPKKGMV